MNSNIFLYISFYSSGYSLISNFSHLPQFIITPPIKESDKKADDFRILERYQHIQSLTRHTHKYRFTQTPPHTTQTCIYTNKSIKSILTTNRIHPTHSRAQLFSQECSTIESCHPEIHSRNIDRPGISKFKLMSKVVPGLHDRLLFLYFS